MTLHTKIEERERELTERFGYELGTERDWLEPDIEQKIHAFNRTSSIELLLEIVKEIEGMKKEIPVEYTYCGCDGECFSNCRRSYNQALTDIQNLIRNELALLK